MTVKEEKEKQEPKNPIEDPFEHYAVVCSCCFNNIKRKDNYCSFCGQRIDWSIK